MLDNPLSRLLSWIVEPHVFLLIRLAADFIAAAWLLWTHDLLVAGWFGLVGLLTAWSERKALRSGAASQAPRKRAST